MSRKSYSQLDLIERHRVNLWWRMRERLQQHIEALNKKLDAYDLSDMPAAESGGGDMSELDKVLDRMQRPE
ncbi:MAG: hypothetical protein KDK30_04800 [Leptospiraceae bacterium]|nr:hypothetical protein [Leptospiraceae bacterium]